jgi:hypothetical protein
MWLVHQSRSGVSRPGRLLTAVVLMPALVIAVLPLDAARATKPVPITMTELRLEDVGF